MGLDPGALGGAASRAATIPRFRSLLVARHGRLAFERYFAGAGSDTRFDVRSVTKSVVSALTGIALSERALPGLDASMAAYLGPGYRLDADDDAVEVRHLLTMTSGYQWDDALDYNAWIRASDHVQYLLDRPRAHPPGTTFTYNSAAVHVLGVVLERATGQPLPQYAQSRLFDPLAVEGASWEPLDNGTVNGGAGLKLRGRQMLKLGQLYLQRGLSGDRSIVPGDWVDSTTRAQFSWRDTHGVQRQVTYGMLWWVSDAVPQSYFAWGYGGQFVYVVPSRDMVVVTTTEWRQLTETTSEALSEQALAVIADAVAAATG